MPQPARPAAPAPSVDDDQDVFGPSGTSDGPSDVRDLTDPDDRVADQPVEQSGMPPSPEPEPLPRLFPDPPPVDLPDEGPISPVNDPDPNAPADPLQQTGLSDDSRSPP
ncbi:MAG: hypothetical protein ACK4MG_06685 [Aquabacterium sp.]